MIYLLFGMSLLFIAIGFVVTEHNAKYILSGYNTMSEAAQKKVDLKVYIPYFRKFHIALGLSFLVIGYALSLFNKNAAGIFIVVYPILAYIYFAISSSKFSGGLQKKSNKIGLVVLCVTLILVIGLLLYGFKESKIVYHVNQIEITGDYGEVLQLDQIKGVSLENELPKITLKTNGFALGTVKKGYFKTENGEVVKLILNSEQNNYIRLTKSNGEKIYYSAKAQSNEDILSQLKNTLSIQDTK